MSKYELRITEQGATTTKTYAREQDAYDAAMVEVRARRNRGIAMSPNPPWAKGTPTFRTWDGTDTRGNLCRVQVVDRRTEDGLQTQPVTDDNRDPIEVEEEDLSEDALRDAIRAGRLRFGTIDVSGVIDTSTSVAEIRRRKGQEQLRQLALENYETMCAVCDVTDPKLLVASHVVGWAERTETRGDLRNVLCLCRFHDALFETGYWSLGDDLHILRRSPMDSATILGLLPPGCSFRPPRAFSPLADYLQHHRGKHGYELHQ